MTTFPSLAPFRQHLTTESIPDISAHVRNELITSGIRQRIQPGMRVAIGLGSRGITTLREIVTPLVETLLQWGAHPFLVPAMGSHGGGTAEGQREVLIGYGLAELGVPILSNMESVQIGTVPPGSPHSGMPVYTDINAAQADAIIVVNRIKPHTAFRNAWESGLMKMLAVGLGKERGAATIHSWGLRDAMPDAARVVLATLPIVAGIGIVENGQHQPAAIEVIHAHQIEAREPALLQLAWQHLPRIPIEPLDLLILQEIGKDISGTGMDLNVVGMWRRTGGTPQPDFRVITALDLTANSHGNAVGIGYCDLVPQRLVDKVDRHVTYTNCLTAGNFNGGKIPITLTTDHAVISAALPRTEPTHARVVIARNTLDLGHLWISESLLPQAVQIANLQQIGPPQPMTFDSMGQLSMPQFTLAAHK